MSADSELSGGDDVDKYSSTPFDCDDGKVNHLFFWKNDERRFPIPAKLEQVARSVYDIPAT